MSLAAKLRNERQIELIISIRSSAGHWRCILVWHGDWLLRFNGQSFCFKTVENVVEHIKNESGFGNECRFYIRSNNPLSDELVEIEMDQFMCCDEHNMVSNATKALYQSLKIDNLQFHEFGYLRYKKHLTNCDGACYYIDSRGGLNLLKELSRINYIAGRPTSRYYVRMNDISPRCVFRKFDILRIPTQQNTRVFINSVVELINVLK